MPDGAGDIGSDVIDVTHGAADFAHGSDGIARRGLDLADVLANFGSRLRGLLGQSLDLVSHYREPASGRPGARGFDGRIERQKIGLLGDGLDQVEHAIDALGRRGETFDFGDRLFSAKPGLLDDRGGLADLPADFLD